MKSKWKVVLGIGAVIVYIAILMYISSIQSDYAVEFITEKETYEFAINTEGKYELPVTVKNNANRMLSSSETDKMFLSYHLYDVNGKDVSYDNPRTSFEKALYSGDKSEILMHMELEPGEYLVELDIVQEGVTWFSQHEDICIRVKVIVK